MRDGVSVKSVGKNVRKCVGVWGEVGLEGMWGLCGVSVGKVRRGVGECWGW